MTPAQLALAKQLIQEAQTLPTLDLLSKLKELGQTGALNAIALVQDPKKMTVLHHLIRAARSPILIEEYIKHLDRNTLNALINLQDSEKSNPMDYIILGDASESILKSILNKADPLHCSKALTSKRPVSFLESLVSTKYVCSSSLKQQLLQIISSADLNDVMLSTDILGNIQAHFAEFIERVDLNVLRTQMTAVSKIKSSPVVGNLGGPDLVRVFALESTSPEVFTALMNRGISLELVYQNLFTIDQIKLSAALYAPGKVILSSNGAGFWPFTVPFSVAAGLMTVAELATRSHGIHWAAEPNEVNNKLHDLLFLKLNEMEFAWLNGNMSFDMKKVLALKRYLKPTSEKAKLQQESIYQAFGKYCKLKQENWQAKLGHLIAAAQSGIEAAQVVLTEHHQDEVQQLSHKLIVEKTRTPALKRLLDLQKLGDTKAVIVLREYYGERIQLLSKPDLNRTELKELKEIAGELPAAARVLGLYYERQVNLGKNYKQEALNAYKLSAKTAAGCFELGRCYTTGVIVNEDIERGFLYYFQAAKNGHSPAMDALESQVITLSSAPTRYGMLAIILLELLNKRCDSTAFIKATQTAPEYVAGVLFEKNSLLDVMRNHGFNTEKMLFELIPLIQSFYDNCPKSASLCKERAGKWLQRVCGQHNKSSNTTNNAVSSTSTESLPNSHKVFLNFCQDLHKQLRELEYQGDIPLRLQNQKFEIMENPWFCNDGRTYCLITDLPNMLGKPSPMDQSILLKLVAPNPDIRRECIEFVEEIKRSKAMTASCSNASETQLIAVATTPSLDTSATPVLDSIQSKYRTDIPQRRDSFQNTETLALLFPSVPDFAPTNPYPEPATKNPSSVDDDGEEDLGLTQPSQSFEIAH